MQTDNLELKKLVYLYLMNYAKSQPDMAIMAVNTFVKVSGSLVGGRAEGLGAQWSISLLSLGIGHYGSEQKHSGSFLVPPTPSLRAA